VNLKCVLSLTHYTQKCKILQEQAHRLGTKNRKMIKYTIFGFWQRTNEAFSLSLITSGRYLLKPA